MCIFVRKDAFSCSGVFSKTQEVMIYCHKLVVSAQGATKKCGYHATFKVNCLPFSITHVALMFTLILVATKDIKHECNKLTPSVVLRSPSIGTKAHTRKQGLC
ncbi:hypothetical protein CsSME_00011928 [Camellia sinensis var. sinensis]